MAEALLAKQLSQESASATEGQDNDHQWEMLADIQQKLSELQSIEKAQREITQMKNEHLKTIQKLNEANRKEAVARETN